MVLNNIFPAAALLGVLSGCLASRHQPIKAPVAEPTAVATVLGVMDSPLVQIVPESLVRRVEQSLTDHNLPPQSVAASSYLDEFSTRRTTHYRLTHLAGQAGDAELLLLLETQAAFYSQMNGRFRWTVEVAATITPTDDLTQAFTVSFQVPVFLDFMHEKEVQAVVAAEPVIARRLETLLDAYLGGLE